jgi:hypothetical protein
MESAQPVQVTVPNVTLTLDQLLAAIRQLDEQALSQVAQVVLETDRDARLVELIRRLNERSPANDVSDELLNAEVKAARHSRAQRPNA